MTIPRLPRILATTAICLAAVVACVSRNNSNPKVLVREIEDNLPIVLYYYKGHTGPIGKGLYIRRADTSNAVYSFSQGVVFGAESRDLNKNQILKISIDDADNINIEYCNAIDFNSKNFYVVFSKYDIYILKFAEGRFGKYHRTIQQYIDESM